MQATGLVSDPYAQLMRDAFAVLDLYVMDIANRDPTRSLNEDPRELLSRVRAALKLLMLEGAPRRENVTEIVRRIDEFLSTECALPQRPVPRMPGLSR